MKKGERLTRTVKALNAFHRKSRVYDIEKLHAIIDAVRSDEREMYLRAVESVDPTGC